MSIGERLRFARKELGLTQGQMAAELRISLSTISDIERGKLKKISNRLVMLMQEVFGLDPNWLLFGHYSQLENTDSSIDTEGNETSEAISELPSSMVTEYDRFPSRDILASVISNTPVRFPGLTELENEIMNLYLLLEPDVRQQVLTELAVCIARNSVNKNLNRGTAPRTSCQHTPLESEFSSYSENNSAQFNDTVSDEHAKTDSDVKKGTLENTVCDDTEFAVEFGLNKKNIQYFDLNGNRIDSPLPEFQKNTEPTESQNKPSKGSKKNSAVG